MLRNQKPAAARPIQRPWRATRISVVALTLTLPLLMLCGEAQAATPAILVSRDLESTPVTVIGLRDGTLSYFDEARRLQREPVSGFVQLRGIGADAQQTDPSQAAAEPSAPEAEGEQPDAGVSGVLELVDGERLVGSLQGAGEAGDVLRWRHELLGDFAVPLERVGTLRLGAGGETDAPAAVDGSATDRVVLANGDTINGFVEGVTAQWVRVIPGGIESGNAAVDLPLDRVASVRLANPATDPPPGADLVHLSDGSRVFGRELAITDDAATLVRVLDRAENREEKKSVTLPLSRLVRVDFTGSGTRLIDLSRRRSTVTAGGEVFGVPMPPRTQGDALVLHAPLTIRFDLSEGATRFAATATLDLPSATTSTQRSLVSLVLIVRSGDTELERFTLDADEPTANINLPLSPGPLVLELDPAANGPILDRVRLTNPLVLLKADGVRK